jgi:hypothetical protein
MPSNSSSYQAAGSDPLHHVNQEAAVRDDHAKHEELLRYERVSIELEDRAEELAQNLAVRLATASQKARDAQERASNLEVSGFSIRDYLLNYVCSAIHLPWNVQKWISCISASSQAACSSVTFCVMALAFECRLTTTATRGFCAAQ